MRRLLHGIAAAGVAGMAALALTAPADAKTCSERLKVCHRFCIKSESGSPGCVAKCGEYLQTCLASGCWESKYVDKECGLTRQ